MIRLNEIKEALQSLVGWEQPLNWKDSYMVWEYAMPTSESGLLYNDAHPLLTMSNMEAIIPEDYYTIHPEWSETGLYFEGDKVYHDKKVWQCTVTQTSNVPGDLSNDWTETPPIIDYAQRQTEKGITQMINRFLSDKSIKGESRPLLDRRTFFDGAGRLNATIANNHQLVGFEIVPVRAMGVTTRIERIGFQGTGGTGNITFYIFHTSQREPMFTKTFNYDSSWGGMKWFTPDTPIDLPYISNGNDSGGAWLFLYDQDNLPQGLEAINVSKDWSKEPCGTCSIGDLQAWREITKYIQISPFSYNAPTTFAEFPECPDVEYLKFTNARNYGLNLEISIHCDLTDFIISQRMLFAQALQLQVAYNVLRTMAMNPDVRVNRNQSNVSRMDILYELDGNTQGRRGGLGNELEKAYNAIELDTRGIDRICLTCNNHGVKYRTV